ncbi:hypothetical protein N0V83_005885 [Neocucurbitaria cava]|uniref:EF-hand domain-containing protein n=1 Tax=Neocucurbitaria cava TaxID=798079 RepID=A0A9W9CL53_9PLEO|nr:hypothetical protein N0V83_005885 [Neocucurbitaria cava]
MDCSHPVMSGGISIEQCNREYQERLDACKAKYGVTTRRQSTADTFKTSKRQNSAASNCSGNSDVFSIADKDYSGNLTLQEYLDFVNYTAQGQLTDRNLIRQWVSYFYR